MQKTFRWNFRFVVVFILLNANNCISLKYFVVHTEVNNNGHWFQILIIIEYEHTKYFNIFYYCVYSVAYFISSLSGFFFLQRNQFSFFSKPDNSNQSNKRKNYSPTKKQRFSQNERYTIHILICSMEMISKTNKLYIQ